MNTGKNLKRVLCYGDSNTWGLNPETREKYPADIRWTGVLQDMLGRRVEVIEEGLRSRTTNIDDPNILGRNGLTYLGPCLETCGNLDACILWLGTNDLKSRFNRTANDIADGVKDCILAIKERVPKAQIIIVVPPYAYETKV